MSGGTPMVSGNFPYSSGMQVRDFRMHRALLFNPRDSTSEPIWTGSGFTTPAQPPRTSD